MADTTDPTKGAITGGVHTLLQAEGAVLFAAPTLFYFVSGAPWQIYALLFFAPDLSLLFYLIGPRAGAFAYNALHSTVGPLLLALVGVLTLDPIAGPIAMIWLAHIGFKRTLGLGLKYGDGFRVTHLGLIGKAPTPPAETSPAKAA